MQPGNQIRTQSGNGGHLVSRGCKLLGARLLCPLNLASGLGSKILEHSQIRRLGDQFGLKMAAQVIRSALSGGT